MIHGTPELMDIDVLENFVIGDPEGKNDSLLEECLCQIPPIREFLIGKKDIVLGEKGAGKTALFRMLTEGKLSFKEANGKTIKIMSLDESIEYKQLKSIIEERIQLSADNNLEAVKYHFIWEVFITYKVLNYVVDELELGRDLLEQYKRDFEIGLGFTDKKVGIMQFLLSHKKTVGIKLDQLHPTSSNFYISAEPVSHEAENGEILKIDLKEVKRKLTQVLVQKNIELRVLLDRIDEFVIKEDYEVQKKLLEGLMQCYRSYATSSQIKINPFLRTDIFNRLDISGLGADKILSKTIHLKWEKNDLRELIARRLYHNIVEFLPIEGLYFEEDEGRLHLDPKYIEEEKLKLKNDNRNILTKWCSRNWNKFLRRFLVALRELNRRERKTNFNDAITTDIIHLIFPQKCDHLTINGKSEYINFIDFIDTHFLFSTHYSTPRVVIDFFEECLYQTRSYYAKNLDIGTIQRNSENEFELVKIECISRAYMKIKEKAWLSISRDASEWESKVNEFKSNLSSKKLIHFNDINKLDRWTNDHEVTQFIAFLKHAGVLKCNNPHKTHSEREYDISILFQIPKVSSPIVMN